VLLRARLSSFCLDVWRRQQIVPIYRMPAQPQMLAWQNRAMTSIHQAELARDEFRSIRKCAREKRFNRISCLLPRRPRDPSPRAGLWQAAVRGRFLLSRRNEAKSDRTDGDHGLPSSFGEGVSGRYHSQEDGVLARFNQGRRWGAQLLDPSLNANDARSLHAAGGESPPAFSIAFF
jgi:hypothetical protein